MRSIRDCSVAVVGGAGFLGSHCTDHLIDDRNCRVLVIDNLCAGRREFIHPKVTFFHADITSSEHCLTTLFLRHKVEYVFNWAAWPYIPNSFERPVHVCNVNFMGALHVINAAQEAGAKGILQVSSAEIYGNGSLRDSKNGNSCVGKAGNGDIVGFGFLDEQSPVVPHSSYGVSKAAVDAFVQTAWRERRTPCIALRQFNCLGERDCLHPYVVPAIIEQLEEYSPPARGIVTRLPVPVVRLGNDSFRDFLYAGDAVRMAVELLEKGQWGEVYNSGSETGIKMYDLARLVGRAMGFADVTVEKDERRVRPWEIWHLQSDNRKLYSVISHRPQVSLEESVQRMVKWQKENRHA